MDPVSLLIVECDPDLLRLVGSHARAHQCDVRTARTVAEAEAAAAASAPVAAAVVALALGSESGLDAIRAIRRHAPDCEVIVVSGTTSVASAIASYELQVFAFLQKPFELDQLFATVDRALEHRRMTLANRRLVWEMSVINEVNEDLRRSLDPAVLMNGALRRLMRILSANSASARLRNGKSGEYADVAFIGPETLRTVWTGMAGMPRPSDRAIATRSVVKIDDTHADLSLEDRARLPVRSALCVPMFAGDELLGTLSLGSALPNRFTQDDRRLIEIIAGQVAIAAQNARLHTYARAGKQQWEATFDAISDPIAVFDSGARLLRGNTALATYLGLPVTEIRGLPCTAIGLCGPAHPECAVHTSQHIGCVRSEVTRDDGQIFAVTTCPVADARDGAAVVQIAKNLTADIRNARRLRQMSDELAATNERLVATVDRLKTTQAQLVQAEKLSAIGQLVAGVAHELNNPLTSVIGYAQLVQEELLADPADLPPRPPIDLAADLRRIAEESERAARIVRNLLAFARRQTAARELQDVADLASRVLALRAYEFRLSSTALETAFDAELPRVLADAGQIQQGLLNLILNAEHAMRGRAVRRLRVGARFVEAAGAVELFVSDSGHGMTPDTMGRIFDPFFTTRDVGEGTGLGLSICYGIVRDHGGQIAVESAPDQGTTFSVLLPAYIDAERQASVLVAHGDPAARDYVAAAMTAWGLDVSIAENADGARARVAAGGLDLACVDASLIAADAGAWHAAAQDAGRLPLVLLTSAGADPVRESVMAFAVLAPPFELRALRGVLAGLSKEHV